MATSARAIASCCCWPPDRTPACRSRNSRTIGKSRDTASRSFVAPGAGSSACQSETEALLDRQLGEDAPALGHERDARARDLLGRLAAHGRARPAGCRPACVGTRPMIACSVVDLPAPFGPIRPTISPGSYLDIERLRDRRCHRRNGPRRRRARASGLLEINRPPLDDRALSGRQASMTSRLLTDPAGVPEAESVVPRSSTWMRSQTSMISAMLWSINRTSARCRHGR